MRAVAVLAAGLAGLVGAAPAAATPSASRERAQLERRLGPGSDVVLRRGSERVRAIGTAPGQPIARPAGLASSSPPAAVAAAFLERFGDVFGVRDPASDLQVTSVRPASAGRSTVRFQQRLAGVPVLGGELVVDVTADGGILAAAGEALADPPPPALPQIDAATARATALAVVARDHGMLASALDAGTAHLWLYDPRIIGAPGIGGAKLVWRIDVTGASTEPIDGLVLVDAQAGVVALHLDQLEAAKTRQVCDAAGTAAQVPCTSPVRTEGGPPSAITDVNTAYDYAGLTYDFYLSNFGRDSLDGLGLPLKSTVRACPTGEPCPYQNAYWDGAQMVYGAGFSAADDVVAHELTHGVTQYTSHLFYAYQSGAINESMSDVFGEFVDQTDGVGTDTPASRWLIGEDLPDGAIRSMSDPTLFNDPDRMTSSRYVADPTRADNGGVHANNGVGNKAAFLITDGGSFNGQTVVGLGVTKAAKIYYEAATHLLTSAADYADLAAALPQGCANVVGTAGITAADCDQVRAAVQAVDMTAIPAAAPNPEAGVCPVGDPTVSLLTDDLESTGSGRWTTTSSGSSTRWYYPQNPNALGFDATYATSGTKNFWGYDGPSVGETSIAMTADVPLPAGHAAFLRFRQSHLFDSGSGGVGFDGGVVEYSTTGGATWNDAGPLFVDNGYNGTIPTGFLNPLGGRSAFLGSSNGYISSRIDVSPLTGQSVRFRFRLGSDDQVDDYGWFVDDVAVYSCSSGVPQPEVTTLPPADVTDTGATLNGSINPNGVLTGYHYEIGSSAGSYTTATTDNGAGSGTTALQVPLNVTGQTANTSYHYRLVAVRSGVVVAAGQDMVISRSPLAKPPTVPGGSPIEPDHWSLGSIRVAGRVRSGRLRIEVRCAAKTGTAPCAGTIVLGRRYGRTGFSVAPGTRTITVRLSKAARRALARRHRLRITVFVELRQGDGTTEVRHVTVTARR